MFLDILGRSLFPKRKRLDCNPNITSFVTPFVSSFNILLESSKQPHFTPLTLSIIFALFPSVCWFSFCNFFGSYSQPCFLLTLSSFGSLSANENWSFISFPCKHFRSKLLPFTLTHHFHFHGYSLGKPDYYWK